MTPAPGTVAIHTDELADWAALLAELTHWLTDADPDTIRDYHDSTSTPFTDTLAGLEAATTRLFRLARQEPPR